MEDQPNNPQEEYIQKINKKKDQIKKEKKDKKNEKSFNWKSFWIIGGICFLGLTLAVISAGGVGEFLGGGEGEVENEINDVSQCYITNNPDGTETFSTEQDWVLYNNTCVRFEDYISVTNDKGDLKVETLDGKSCKFELEYEKTNVLDSAQSVLNIDKVRNGWYFTSDAQTEVNSMAYKLNCSDFDVNFDDYGLYLGNFKVNFKPALTKQNITTTYDSKNNKLVFDRVNGSNASLSFIDPSILLNNSYTFADIHYWDGVVIPGNYGGQIKWDITDIPEGVTIDDGELCLWIDFKSGSLDNDLTAWYINDQSWSESSDQAVPGGQTELNQTSETLSSTDDDSWSCFNVTTQLTQSYVNGNENFTIRFEDPDYYVSAFNRFTDDSDIYFGSNSGGAYLVFEDREGTAGTAFYPYLNVTYSTSDSRTSVSDCGALSSDNTEYYLTGNVSGTDSCIIISGENSSLNLEGYWVNYGSSSSVTKHGIVITGINSSAYNGSINLLPHSSGTTKSGLRFYADRAYAYDLFINNTASDSSGRGVYFSDYFDNCWMNNVTIHASGYKTYGVGISRANGHHVSN